MTTASSTRGDTPHLASPEINPSFTRGIFLGELQESLVFPFPALEQSESESLSLILNSIQEFSTRSVDSQAMDRAGKFPEAMLEEFHSLGLMGLNIPEAYGGYEASARVFSRVFGELGSVDPALTVYFGAHSSIGCKGIILFGNETQKQKWLPACATGEKVAAFCLTEPGSGSDAQAMASTAVISPDGAFYTLNGTKIWISNAGYASVLTVFAKVPIVVDGKEKHAVTAFIVDAHSDGIQLGEPEHKMGIRASDTRTITFENVQVPVENVLGEVGHGFKVALEILNSGRLGLAAASSCGARKIMNVAIDYANQRHQFGRPIGSFEMIQRKIAMAAANIYAADSATMLTAGMVDRGGIDFSLETAICKVFASEVAVEATTDAMQIAGGIGYSQEFPYEQAMRDARINMIFEGTNEVLRALIALSGLQHPGERMKQIGAAFKAPLHSLGFLGSALVDRAKRTVIKPAFRSVHPTLASKAGRVATLIHDFSLAVDRALLEHGKAIIDHQFIQERMADVVIDIYLSTAVLSRTTWKLERAANAPEKQAAVTHAEECAHMFLNEAYRRAQRNIANMQRNQDRRMKAVAELAIRHGDVAPAMPYEDF